MLLTTFLRFGINKCLLDCTDVLLLVIFPGVWGNFLLLMAWGDYWCVDYQSMLFYVCFWLITKRGGRENSRCTLITKQGTIVSSCYSLGGSGFLLLRQDLYNPTPD